MVRVWWLVRTFDVMAADYGGDYGEQDGFSADEECEALPVLSAEKAMDLMSPSEISSFMQDKGIPQEYCKVFEGI